MFIHFPPTIPDPNDGTMVVAKGKAFAKLKKATKAEKRRVFLTEHTLVFVRKGAKVLHFGEDRIEVQSGQMIFLKKGVYVMAEYLENGLDFEAILIFLEPDIIKDTMIAARRSHTWMSSMDSFLILNSNSSLDNFMNSIAGYFETPQLRHAQLLQIKQKELLLLLLSFRPADKLEPFLNSLTDQLLQNIEYIVNKHLLQPLSIVDYANLSNRSLTSFKRDFQEIFKMPPRKWINQKRLERAYLLLINTDQRINEIADYCGFENPSYFIKLFKEHYFCTPRALRTKIAIT